MHCAVDFQDRAPLTAKRGALCVVPGNEILDGKLIWMEEMNASFLIQKPEETEADTVPFGPGLGQFVGDEDLTVAVKFESSF